EEANARARQIARTRDALEGGNGGVATVTTSRAAGALPIDRSGGPAGETRSVGLEWLTTRSRPDSPVSRWWAVAVGSAGRPVHGRLGLRLVGPEGQRLRCTAGRRVRRCDVARPSPDVALPRRGRETGGAAGASRSIEGGVGGHHLG